MTGLRNDPVYDVAVVGRGLAGMAAAMFAAGRGLSVVQVGMTGELVFASGLLDVLGVHPVTAGRMWDDPWEAIRALVRDEPAHPYARIAPVEITEAVARFAAWCGRQGLAYRWEEGRNVRLITSMGTVKNTYAVPESMWPGVEAFSGRRPTLVVGFEGLREFSARQTAAVLQDRWPSIRAVQVPFPEDVARKEMIPGEILAQSFESPRVQERLAESLAVHIRDAEFVGFPALLGMGFVSRVKAWLEERLGVEVFEIPTPPVSVPGLRLQEACVRGLRSMGVRTIPQRRVTATKHGARGFRLKLDPPGERRSIAARAVVLATGRFWGRGLWAGREGIHESVFDLPVYQPASRDEWHRQGFLTPAGHPIHRCGLRVDRRFRPVDAEDRPAFETLFAVGSILAHQDWMRMKCGGGLAVSTALAAVEACARTLGT